jgi:hypothetical protein
MKKVMFLLSVMAILFAGCEKFEYNDAPEKPSLPEDNAIVVELRHSLGDMTKNGSLKNIIYSGQTIAGNKEYFFNFWLTASGSQQDPEGEYEIRNEDSIVYGPSSPRNGIEHKFQEAGTYILEVSGVFEGESFNFENIQITVTEEGVVELETHPVRLYNFEISGETASVEVAISKEEYSNIDPSTEWNYLKRINGSNFENGLEISEPVEYDSVRFVLSFDAEDNDYIEFNAHHGSEWLTPSLGNPPSILYSGSSNEPYLGSGSYFGFRFHIVGEDAELRTYDDQLLLTAEEGTSQTVPGENGDELSHNYQVRWTGYTRWFKTTTSSPSFRWKIGTEGEWEYITPSEWSNNPEYWEIELPDTISGELRFQFGEGTGLSFAPSSNEMNNSQYYEFSSNELVVNI